VKSRTRINTNPCDTKTNAAGCGLHVCVACETDCNERDARLVYSLCLSGYTDVFSSDVRLLDFFVLGSSVASPIPNRSF